MTDARREVAMQTGSPVDDTDVLTRLMAIWADVLGTGAADADTDFIDHGGTSLTAVRIRGRIRTEFGKDLDTLDILDNPTPKQLAALVPEAPEWSAD
jgi:acyl carrier protein